MEWVIVNPSSIHEVCGLLGHTSSTTGEYCMKKETCENGLDTLLAKLNGDGPTLRTRRALGISQVINKDILPLLISATTDAPKIVRKIIKLLSNLTSPIEVLVPEDFSSTEEGQQVVYELDSLLKGMKSEFADFKATKAIVDYLKILTNQDKLSPEECEELSEGLLLLRNILHIPHKDTQVQNQIMWNLFAHNLDKILLHLMTCEQKSIWVITLVQLIALIYKDQHVSNLQKLLNLWLENSMSESSEDNESNTSPYPESSCNSSSSPMLTSEPTSDSSDNGGRSLNDDADGTTPTNSTTNKNISIKETAPGIPDATITTTNSNTSFRHPYPLSHSQQSKCYTKAKSKSKTKMAAAMILKERMSDADSGICSMVSSQFSNEASQTATTNTDDSSETGTHSGHNINVTVKQENTYKQECNSTTSSNEDEQHVQQPIPSIIIKSRDRNSMKISQKLRNPPIIIAPQDKQELKRKKLHKRSKRTRKNLKAFAHHNATEEDISHILKEFTVDFLLKGYGSLVSSLQEQLSVNSSIEIDKSHFLWLLTYFLKFAAQLELDLEHISPVLSYKMLSYLTYEGIAMCENLSLCKGDMKPHLRRMHLVVTALREFVQAVEMYSKMPSFSHEDKEQITKLRNDILNTEEFRHLFLVLIRHFKPGVQSKQYLQDLVTTNHIFLLFLEKVATSADYKGGFKMTDFIKEFSSPLIMQNYGHLLEDFSNNGLFINDCIFTMMHHIAGDLTCPESLFQPLILRTFSKIWEVEFEIRDETLWWSMFSEEFGLNGRSYSHGTFRLLGLVHLWGKYAHFPGEDWADLIEYIIQRFMKTSSDEKRNVFYSGTSNVSDETGWTKDDTERLYWFYSNCATSSDPIAKILEAYGESASGKSRESILNQLLHQRIIGYNQFLLYLAAERFETADHNDENSTSSSNANSGASLASTLIDQLRSANKTYNFSGSNPENNSLTRNRLHAPPPMPLDILEIDMTVSEVLTQIVNEGHDLFWIQKQVLEVCYVKLTLEQCGNKIMETEYPNDFKNKSISLANMEPIPYHYCLLGQSIPIIPWTHNQEILLMSPPCLLVLHKLGFHLPGDVGKRFPRIPHFWTTDFLYNVASKLGPVPQTDELKFDPSTFNEMPERNDDPCACDVKPSVKVTGSSGIKIADKPQHDMPGAGVSVGGVNGFTKGHVSYCYPPPAQSVNWMNLVHKSKQLIDRQSEAVLSSSTTSCSDSESEHMEDCNSLKALPPTDHSEDVTMMSDGSGQEDNDGDEDEEDDTADL